MALRQIRRPNSIGTAMATIDRHGPCREQLRPKYWLRGPPAPSAHTTHDGRVRASERPNDRSLQGGWVSAPSPDRARADLNLARRDDIATARVAPRPPLPTTRSGSLPASRLFAGPSRIESISEPVGGIPCDGVGV